MVTVWWSAAKPSQRSPIVRKSTNVPKIPLGAAGTRQQKRFDPASRHNLPYPLYSLVLSPTNSHFFKDFDNFLTGRTFANQDQTKTAFLDFIESRAPDFYAEGINRLVLRWQKCTESNSAYSIKLNKYSMRCYS